MAHLTPLDDASWINIMGYGVPKNFNLFFDNLKMMIIHGKMFLKQKTSLRRFSQIWLLTWIIFCIIYEIYFSYQTFYIYFGYTLKFKYRSLMIFVIIFSLLTIETIFWGQIIALFDLKIWFSQIWRIEKKRHYFQIMNYKKNFRFLKEVLASSQNIKTS